VSGELRDGERVAVKKRQKKSRMKAKERVRELVGGREGIMRAVISVADLVSWVCKITIT
jgi:hypothetical protein